jgi:hypothetical protein
MEYISGYFRSPDGQTINGVQQLNIWNCGPIPGGFLCYVRCKIGDYPDSAGQTTELPETSFGCLDSPKLFPVIAARMNLGKDGKGKIEEKERIVAEKLGECPRSQKEFFTEATSYVEKYGSFLSSSYLAATWDELMELYPDMLVVSTDDEGNEFSNITRCSLDTF